MGKKSKSKAAQKMTKGFVENQSEPKEQPVVIKKCNPAFTEDEDGVVQEESPRREAAEQVEKEKGKTAEAQSLKEITNYYGSAQKEPSITIENTEKQQEAVVESPRVISKKESPQKVNNFAEEAIPLIQWNKQDDRFQISQEAKHIVSQITGPIGVLAVAGVYRTGKSHLLNRVLLDVQNGRGFGVGPSINPCTKGLWMWATPVVGYTESGEQMSVLVIDSEGIGGLDEDGNHDMRIFSLALLLSSFFIYNSMGSIDENALSALSFVTNISKHISVKTSTTAEDSAGTDLTDHMPKFMWVVRDFSLQLVNDNNDEITASQYLERALEDLPAGDNSEAISKNEVKQHLRKFFTKRDCFTMVRPVVDEANLQNLDALGTADLRAEFVEQVISLREKVLHGMHFKQVNDTRIDGATWVQMVEQYIGAINDGTVPSIESSWTYICRQRAEGAYEQQKSVFDQAVMAELQAPVNERDLEQCFEYHAEKFRSDLVKDLLGETESAQDIFQRLDEYVRARLAELQAQNLNECRQLSTNTLTQLFQELNQRFMADTSVESLSQHVKALDYTLQEIWGLYDGNVPEYSEKHLIFLNAKSSFLNDLVYFIQGNLANEIESLSSILNEIKDRNHASLLEVKEGFRIESQAMETKLKETTLAKAETDAALELLKEQYAAIKAQKEQEEQSAHLSLKELKDQLQKRIEEHRKDKDEFDDKIQAMNRNNIKVESEFEKERALFEQKVMFLEKSLEEKSSTEKEYLSNWNNQKSELSSEIRSVCQKYEAELKENRLLLEEEKEKNTELEAQLQELQSTLDEKSNAWAEQEQRYKQMIDQTQDHAKQIEMAANFIGKESLADIEQKLQEKTEICDELAAKCKAFEERATKAEEELKSKILESMKELALKQQKLEFQEIQLTDMREQLDDANKQHQSMVEAMNQGAEKEDEAAQIAAAPSESPSKAERLQARLESLQGQLATAQDRAEELELQLKLQETEADRIQKELMNKIEDLDQQRTTMSTRFNDSEASQSNQLAQMEQKFKEEVAKLEQELEDKHVQCENDIKLIQSRSEESLAQLKSFYETEKDKLEARLREERERAQQKINEYHEEFEGQMRQELAEKDEEMEMLRESLSELEQRHNQQATQVSHELNMKEQILGTLEKQNTDQKQRIEMMESTRNQAFEKQLEFFEQQRQEYNSKIDKLQSDNLDKDRQLALISHKNERTVEDLERKNRDITQSLEQVQSERDTLQEKLDATKRRLNDVQDEAQQSQLVYGRDQALSQQSIEFLQRKIQELSGQLEDRTLMYEQKLNAVRQELTEENQSHIDRIQNERDVWEQKFDQKRKALKEIEQQLNRENAELEKKLCILQENYSRLDMDKRRQEIEFSEKQQDYELQIQSMDTNAGEAFFYGNAQAESIMQLKNTMQELERQLSDLQSMYDKDKALWEGKCQFLENQKENYKKDLIESQRKFEITLEQLQKRGNSAQDKYEHNQNALIKVIENKYKNQIKEMLESHQCLQTEVQNKNKRLEEETKKQSQSAAIERRQMEVELTQLKAKTAEMAKKEACLENELQELRLEKDQKQQLFQEQAKADKDSFKSRLTEAERKCKEADQKRAQMLFEHEKQKAKWQMEFDGVCSQKRELEDIIANLERRKDLLFKENERLKHEWKGAGSQKKRNQSRSSVEGRNSIGGGSVASSGAGIMPKLGLGLANALSAAANGLPPSSSNYSSKKSNQGPMLGLRGSLQAPQPQKYQFQMAQPQLNTRYGHIQNSGSNSALTESSQQSQNRSLNQSLSIEPNQQPDQPQAPPQQHLATLQPQTASQKTMQTFSNHGSAQKKTSMAAKYKSTQQTPPPNKGRANQPITKLQSSYQNLKTSGRYQNINNENMY